MADRPSVLLLLAGIASLTISLWSLTGADGTDLLGGLDGRWIFVLAAVVGGLALVLVPGRRR